jgi:hypothetical protein
MEFDWWDYFRLAQCLRTSIPSGASDEAAWRCAVGRAYYAAFGIALEYAESRGFTPRGTGDDHVGVADHFKSNSRPGVASRLHQLRKWRNLCDYERACVGVDFVSMLDSALKAAQFVFDAVGTPPRSLPVSTG